MNPINSHFKLLFGLFLLSIICVDSLHSFILWKQCIDHGLINIILDSVFFDFLVLLRTSFSLQFKGRLRCLRERRILIISSWKLVSWGRYLVIRLNRVWSLRSKFLAHLRWCVWRLCFTYRWLDRWFLLILLPIKKGLSLWLRRWSERVGISRLIRIFWYFTYLLIWFVLSFLAGNVWVVHSDYFTSLNLFNLDSWSIYVIFLLKRFFFIL